MATKPRSGSRPLEGPYPRPTRPNLTLVKPAEAEVLDQNGVEVKDGVLTIRHDDGSVTVDFDPSKRASIKSAGKRGFDANLALDMEESNLSEIATELLEGIERDEISRKDWLATRAQGIELLGLKIEKPRTDVGSSGAVEGMSTIRHPALLEATISFQATARAELLPASGPVKIRNDAPPPPKDLQLQATSAQKELADSLQGKDELAQALETDANHYLTCTATEYVPDTDRMLFYVGFGGDGFKKVYNCPLRQRPVSESVDAKDLIVSNGAVDLQSCGRVTHRIMMRKSVLRRMQIMGVYLDTDLSDPVQPQQTAADKAMEDVQGVTSVQQRPEDRDYEIYETYCELELDQFAPKQFKGKGLPLPYRVTVDKNSRKVLDIRRNWKEDDDQCIAKQFFVQFPFVRGLGFYGLGFIHILGNTANTLTAAWRLILDNGMFANFPGFLYAKGAGRQNSNQFRVAPGTGVGLDVGAQQNIRDSVMALPYKEAGPAFTGFITHVEEVARRLAAVADINVGEGKQDAPVGTTLALIEQATKVIDSAHKRLHAAQAEEFKLLKERFREDPEAFWRHNPNASLPWRKAQFLKALDDYDLVPVADPNNPTSLHRIAKAMALKELQKGNPNLYDPVAVDMRVMRIIGIDPQGLMNATPTPAPPDPRMEAIQQKAKQQADASANATLQAKIKAATAYAQMEDKEKDRQSRERIEMLKLEIEKMQVQQAETIHANDIEHDKTLLALAAKKAELEQFTTMQKAHADLQVGHLNAAHEIGRAHQVHVAETQRKEREHQQQTQHDDAAHSAQQDRDRETHQAKLEGLRETNAAKVEAARAMARAKPKPAAKKKKD